MKPLTKFSPMRGFLAASCVCAALAPLAPQDAAARTLAEVKSLGAISMCANADALPYASNKPDTPGFQIEADPTFEPHQCRRGTTPVPVQQLVCQ